MCIRDRSSAARSRRALDWNEHAAVLPDPWCELVEPPPSVFLGDEGQRLVAIASRRAIDVDEEGTGPELKRESCSHAMFIAQLLRDASPYSLRAPAEQESHSAPAGSDLGTSIVSEHPAQARYSFPSAGGGVPAD